MTESNDGSHGAAWERAGNDLDSGGGPFDAR
jgi:hypothetical protein